jgi:hypothetical protein
VRGDFTGSEAFRAQRQHDLIHARQPALAFLHDLRIERRPGVPRDVDLHRPDLGQHGLRTGAVAGVPAAASGHVVFSVSEVFIHFRLQGGLQNVFRQPVQQPVRTDEVDALLFGLGQELLR